MGLFGNNQNGESISNSHMNGETQYKEAWEFYISNVDDILGSFFVDLGLQSIAPIKNKQMLIWVSIIMNNPKENGLSSNEESSILFDIEDKLVKQLTSHFDATYSGRLTWNKRRDFYFYVGNSTLYDKVISEVMVAFPRYHYEFDLKEEKDWKTYLTFLCPSAQQMENIKNRHVVDLLEKGGDSLIKSREVDHWIYFKTNNDRDNFLTRISNDGFTIVDNDFDESLGTFPFRLHIKRLDKVDLNSVDEYVINLWKIANECNGDYDGWETSVEKD